MSFGTQMNVGSLQATFALDASRAMAQIADITTQMATLTRTMSGSNVLRIDTGAANSALQTTTGHVNTLKRALEFGGAVLGIGLLAKAFEGIGTAIFGINGKLEQANASLTVLTGDAGVAGDMVNKLELLASHSTFGLQQITQSAQALLAFGVAAQNVAPLIQAIQNAAAASGGDIENKYKRISLAIEEIGAKGKVSAVQLNMLARAGVPLNQIAEQLGITEAQLLNVGKTGVVTSEQFIAAFHKVYTEGKLGDFMAVQAGTFNGALQIMKTNLSLAVAQGFEPLFQAVSKLVVKIGLFVQTATFNTWVANVKQAVEAVMGLLQTLGNFLEPIGRAMAALFGLNTGNIAAEMEAAKNMKVDVGEYDAAAQGAAKSTNDLKGQIAGYTATAHEANQAIVGLNEQLAGNKLLLDANAEAIKRVKDAWDPAIASASESIRKINLLTPDELSRKERELTLDKDRSALELRRPDVSGLDSRIANDRIALDAMPALDTAQWDDPLKKLDKQISHFDMSSYTGGIKKQIDTLQDSDPAAPFRATIQGIQDAMSALDPEAATKSITTTIQAIRDHSASLDPEEATRSITETIRAIQEHTASLDPEAATKGITNTIQAIRDHIASLDPEAATKNITDTIQGIRDHIASLDPEEATKGITRTIQSIQEAMRTLDPVAATQGITDTIQGIQEAMRALDPQAATQELTSQIDAIKAAMSALDPTAATGGITSQIQAIQDEIHGLNTSELDEKIQHVRDALSAPAPDTTGLSNQLASISAQMQGAGAGADTGALQAQYASLSAQKRGVVQKYEQDQTGLKGQLSLLEQERANTRLVQAETKRADEARIVDLREQAKAITTGITEQRKAMQEQVVGLESQKKAVTEGIAEQRKAMQERVVGLEHEKKVVEEGVASQRKAMEERIVGLEHEKQSITEEIADQKKADESKIIALTRQAAAIKEGIADQRKADEGRIVDLTRQAATIKEGIADERKADADKIRELTRQSAAIKEGIADERKADAAKIVGLERQSTAIKEGIADQRKAGELQIRGLERQASAAEKTKANGLRQLGDDLEAARKRGEADKKVLEDQREGLRDARKEAVDADADARKKLTDDIKKAEGERLTALAPYTAEMKKITNEQATLNAQDRVAAADRTLALAPYKKALDDANEAKRAGLLPLETEKERLTEIKTKLDEQKSALTLKKQEAQASAQAAKDEAAALKAQTDELGKQAGLRGGGTDPSGKKDTTDAKEKSPLVKRIDEANEKLKIFQGFMAEHPALFTAARDALLVFVGALAVMKIALLVEKDLQALGQALAVLTSPVALVVLGIAALAAGFVLLYERYQPFHNAINEIVDTFKNKGLSAAISLIADDLKNLADRGISYIVEKAPGFLNALKTWGEKFVNFIAPYIEPMLEELGKLELRYLGWIGEQSLKILTKLGEWGVQFAAWVAPRIGPMLEELGKLTLRLLSWVGEQARPILTKLGEWAVAFKDWIGPALDRLGPELVKIIDAVFAFISKNIGPLTDKLLTWADQFIRWVAPYIPKLIIELGLLYLQLADWVLKRVPDIAGQLLMWAAEFIKWVAIIWSELQVELGSLLLSLLGWIGDRARDLASKLGEWVAEFVNWVGKIWAKLLVEVDALFVSLNGWIGDRARDLATKLGEWVGAFVNWTAQVVKDLPGNLATIWTALTNFIDQVVRDLPAKLKEIVDLFSGIGHAIGTGMQDGLNGVLDLISGLIDKIAGGVNTISGWFGNIIPTIPEDFKIPHVGFLADGTVNWKGGKAIVGEDGRELVNRQGDRNTGPLAGWQLATGPTLMDLPSGAQVIPNRITEQLLDMGMPGFAGGLDVLGGIKNIIAKAGSTIGGVIQKGENWAADEITTKFGGLDLPGVLKGLGPAIIKEGVDGIKALIHSLFSHTSVQKDTGSGARGGGIAGAGELVAAILAATGDKAEQMAMLMGAFIESNGQNVAQLGGGPGAGYWQIEAGPGGQYEGQVDPYNAMAAARFMLRDYDAAMGYFNPNNLEDSLVQVVVHAERPAGLKYGDGQIANAWAAIQPMLVNGGIAAPTSAPGFVGPSQWGSVVEQAMRHLGEVVQPGVFDENGNPVPWNGWCEKFMDNMDDAAGFGSYRAGTAFLHGVHAQSTGTLHAGDPNAPAGASVWFDQSWGSAGHAAIATGNGNETISTPIADGHNDIHYADVIGSSGYMGWAPPGLAEGGYFPANDPRLAVVGEGRHDEIVAPIPMLREVVRSESGGSTISINFESGAIVTHPGQASEDVARMIVTEMQERVMMADKRARGFAG